MKFIMTNDDEHIAFEIARDAFDTSRARVFDVVIDEQRECVCVFVECNDVERVYAIHELQRVLHVLQTPMTRDTFDAHEMQ